MQWKAGSPIWFEGNLVKTDATRQSELHNEKRHCGANISVRRNK